VIGDNVLSRKSRCREGKGRSQLAHNPEPRLFHKSSLVPHLAKVDASVTGWAHIRADLFCRTARLVALPRAHP
jgi:hypothetical protein